jgi:hypothetical protein
MTTERSIRLDRALVSSAGHCATAIRATLIPNQPAILSKTLNGVGIYPNFKVLPVPLSSTCQGGKCSWRYEQENSFPAPRNVVVLHWNGDHGPTIIYASLNNEACLTIGVSLSHVSEEVDQR